MRASIVVSALLFLATPVAADQAPPRPVDPARRTATSRIVARCLPSVVSIHAFAKSPKPNEQLIHDAAGSIIHPAGWVLTNAHVIGAMTHGEARLDDGRKFSLRQVAVFSHEDLALGKLETSEKFVPIELGRSDDLILGEPAISIGNPAGLMSTVSEGIVSGLRRATTTEQASLPSMIQTSAAISGGSSGGPLINALGQEIGVITSRKADAENIGFAISIDHVRETMPAMIAAEQRGGFRLGLAVDMLADEARVTTVDADSPAASAAIRPGDVIEGIDGVPVRQGVDFHLSLLEHKPGDVLMVDMRRGAEKISSKIALAPQQPAPPAPDGLTAGLDFRVYDGAVETLHKFDALTPTATGQAADISLSAAGERKENYCLVFSGWIKIPAEGLYIFYLNSDDGSRLTIDGRTVVDNDGLHPPREVSGVARLSAGCHALQIDYLQAGGEASLELFSTGPGIDKAPVPAEAFFRRG